MATLEALQAQMPILPENRFVPGMSRTDAVGAFRECVNQPQTIFSTDHWLRPKLDSLRLLLHDPITADEVSALLDVLYKRHFMKDLLEWLTRKTEPWSMFFVDREERHAALSQAQNEWLNNFGKPLSGKQRALIERKHLAAAKKEYLPIAKPCASCGLPPEKLEWFHYPSLGATRFTPGRIGWQTRCGICRQEIDFFTTMLICTTRKDSVKGLMLLTRT